MPSSLIPPDLMRDLRPYFESTFDQEAVITRAADAIKTPYGGETPLGTTRHTLPCRVRPSSQPRLVTRGATQVMETVYLLRCALDSDVRGKDQVEVAGQSYAVLETDRGRSGATVLTATLILTR